MDKALIKAPPSLNSEKVSSLSKDYQDELLDRVLSKFSPSRLAIDLERSKDGAVPVDILTRDGFFDMEFQANDVWLSDPDEYEELGSDHEARNPYDRGESMPMIERNVVILDSGRGDGLTEALCECFCKLGAEVVVTLDRHKTGAKKAEMIVNKCKTLPGSVKMVEGVPYRSRFLSSTPPGVLFAEDLVDQVFHLMEERKEGPQAIDCIGKFTC